MNKLFGTFPTQIEKQMVEVWIHDSKEIEIVVGIDGWVLDGPNLVLLIALLKEAQLQIANRGI